MGLSIYTPFMYFKIVLNENTHGDIVHMPTHTYTHRRDREMDDK